MSTAKKETPWRSEARRADTRVAELVKQLMGPEYEEGEWVEQALCAQIDPELFFPTKGQNSHQAKAACRSCPVIDECLEYALDNEIDCGVWGGTSPRERRVLLAERDEEHLAG